MWVGPLSAWFLVHGGGSNAIGPAPGGQNGSFPPLLQVESNPSAKIKTCARRPSLGGVVHKLVIKLHDHLRGSLRKSTQLPTGYTQTEQTEQDSSGHRSHKPVTVRPDCLDVQPNQQTLVSEG